MKKENGFYCCIKLAKSHLRLGGMVDRSYLSVCCEKNRGISNPEIKFTGNPEEAIDQYLDMRDKAIAEGFLPLDDEGRELTKGCIHCKYYEFRDWRLDSSINYISLTPYPSPCQAKCIYCGVLAQDYTSPDAFNEEGVAQKYDNYFAMIDYLFRKGIVSKDVRWSIGSGEITVHPLKKRFYNLIGNSACDFFTNCFKYDETIANNLKKNPKSSLSFSIDAGTPEAWHKVKGFNNFETAVGNLSKYCKKASSTEQIRLRYIVLPGINDDLDDFLSIAKIMNLNNLKNITLSFDFKYARKKENTPTKQYEALMFGTAMFCYLLDKHNLTYKLPYFTRDELALNNLLMSSKELAQTKEKPKKSTNTKEKPKESINAKEIQKELAITNEELRKAKVRIKAIETSMSWRITKPLRIIAASLRKIRFR